MNLFSHNNVFIRKWWNYFFFLKKKEANILNFFIYNQTTRSKNVLNLAKSCYELIMFFFIITTWFKIRVLYYLNNWIYTTNHKRIAVNYFWFVILSGIVGMVLATVIRLEFAYPGVGIFAGDSIQYLSVATAHGVIMVFFMIMPLIFGAFANFLLPTQLGVHDVAFPRLNSAAFWFLPGGLLMLAQLVCVDRRYQRMNCFNIREIQSILKKRFFTDLINEHDHRDAIHQTMMSLKFKINHNNINDPNFFLFYNYGTSTTPKIKTIPFNFLNFNQKQHVSDDSYLFYFIFKCKTSIFFIFLNNIFFSIFSFFESHVSIVLLFKNTINFILSIYYYFFTSTMNIFKWFDFLLTNLNNIDILAIKYLLLKFKIKISTVIFNVFYFYFSQFIIEFSVFHMNTKTVINFLKNFNFSYWVIHLSDFFFLFNVFEMFFIFNNIIFNLNVSLFKINSFFFHNIANLLPNFSNFFIFLPISNYTINEHTSTQFFFSKNKSETFFFFLFNENKNEQLDLKKFYSHYNFNSHISYFYVLTHFFKHLPYFLLSFIYNIFNFKEMSVLVNDFANLFTTWYIPLILNDNVFYIFWQKTYNFFYKIKDLNPTSMNSSFLAFVQLFLKNFSFDFLIYLNSFWKNLFSFFNFFFFNVTTLFKSIIFNFCNILTILFYNDETYLFFKYLYECSNASSINVLNQKNLNTFLNNNFNSKYFSKIDAEFQFLFSNEELFSNSRYHRFDNPLFKYDYKSGDYYPKLYKEVYSHLITSFIELTGGIRQSSWFFSNAYTELLNDSFSIFKSNMQLKNSTQVWALSRFSNLDIFYNFFSSLSVVNLYLNKRWISFNTMDQKFYKFFHTSSMQQRIYSNWRHLKFSREAWRCKLLMARHQKTLFKRYVNEDGVFWSIERNAKDLLPGWAMITPFSSRTRFTAIGKVDIGLMAVLLVLNSSIISGANFLVTYRYLSTLNNRKMRDARSFFTEAVMVASWMMIAANPMLVIGIIMLLSDRHWQTSFFDYSGGGDTVLFQHMFWFFGHPEVYIVILPTFGFVNTMLSYYLKKRVSARASLLYSMYTIAFLGFFVWGHHMYMVGLAHTTRMLFSTLTVMISVPAATKLMHWCVTTVNSSFAMELPLVYTLTFIFLFVSGGISGMCVAHTGMDVLFHDTFYVIGHFHVMFAGAAMIGSFGAFYFYFVAIFGVKYSRIYAYLHFTYYLIGQLFTVIPMFWLGYAGMPRRVLDYPSSFGGWHSVISGGHMLSVAGLIAFFIMIFDSLRQAKAATRNTFGIGRYNTRLNFYIYEIAKLNNVQEKAWTLFKFLNVHSFKLNNFNFFNFEKYETILFSYTFSKK